MNTILPAAALALVGMACCATRAAAVEPQRLWVYSGVNFQVDESTDQLLALLKRAKAAGYNGAVITDYKFGRIDDRPERYYKNLQRTRAAADELEIELIPCVMPIGYSGAILQNNPNLAAGLPVKDCAFIVKDGLAIVAESTNLLPGGSFEKSEKDRPAGWDWIDGFGTSTSIDAKVKHSGNSSLAMRNFREGNEHGNCRLVKKLTLKPWHQYRLSLWVKTENLDNAGDFKANPLADGRTLNFAALGVQPTQDWTRHAVVFNSLELTEVPLYLGLWEGEGGSIWIDDASLEIVGGVNLLRRGGCPIRVASEDGKTKYVEGHDFEKWADPKLGQVPYAGEFDDDHEAPAIVLTKDSRIKEGQRFAVSFYHTVKIHDDQVCSTLVHTELFKHLIRQVELVDQHLKPKTYFMQHDEIRVGGYDAGETASGNTACELLATNARSCVEIIKRQNPKAEIVVWSDMFDPHHNAVDNYYLVRGTLKGSWEALDKSVGIVNWNGGHAGESLKFFADRGHQQIIAGYYDDDVRRNFNEWNAAAKSTDGVSGWMYTTWRGEYKDLEAFAKLVREATE